MNTDFQSAEKQCGGLLMLVHDDCFNVFPTIHEKSVDLVLADPPYGVTSQKWDSILPFELLWKELKRLIKPHAPIILFGREPFTSMLISSNIKNYKHKWVWNKKQSGSFQNAKFMPLQIDEDIIVFCYERCNYFPIMRKGKMRKRGGAKEINRVISENNGLVQGYFNYSDEYFPVNIIEMANPRKSKYHPTEKPVELLRYLIKTYSKEGDTVLDFCAGSGSTGVACLLEYRQFIGIEKDNNYYNIAVERMKTITQQIM